MVAVLLAATALGAVTIPPARHGARTSSFAARLADAPRPAAAAVAPGDPGRVLVQIFRGRARSVDGAVEVATIFRDPGFALLADAPVMVESEEALQARVRDLFSLDEVDLVGSSLVPLPGGAAVMDDGGRRVKVRVEGERVGHRALRLVIGASLDGSGEVTTSVIAREGHTVLLAGQPSAGHVSFLCLTPLPGASGDPAAP